MTMLGKNSVTYLLGSVFAVSSVLVTQQVAASHGGSTSGTVQAVLETYPTFDDDAGNNADADDPAIWVHPDDEEDSIVITTLKEGGIDVFNLQGQLLQHIPGGPGPNPEVNHRYNNVHIVYDFELDDDDVDLAVVTNRGTDKLEIYVIDEDAAEDGNAPLSSVLSPSAPFIFVSSLAELEDEQAAQGLAAAKLENGSTIAFVTRNDRTDVAKLKLFEKNGKVSYSVTNRFHLPSTFTLPNGTTWTPCTDEDGLEPTAEGMEIDREHGKLYIAQELVGVLKTTINNSGSNLSIMDKAVTFGVPYTRTWDPEEEEYICEYQFAQDPGYSGQHLQPDIEGITIYEADDGEGYVLTSSQGDNSFVVYDREGDNDFIGKFQVTDGAVDSTQETDGLHVSNADFGGQFDNGLLVVQDGENTPFELDEEGEERDGANFKFIQWEDVANELDLIIDTEEDIRLDDDDDDDDDD